MRKQSVDGFAKAIAIADRMAAKAPEQIASPPKANRIPLNKYYAKKKRKATK